MFIIKVKVELVIEIPHWETEEDIEKDIIKDILLDGIHLKDNDITKIDKI